MKMKLVPQSEVISESDIVVTSGLEDLVPANLIIGQVERIYNQPEELFQEVSIRTFVDLGKITIVNIIKKVDDI
jgi:cell shape-determining protein MreC